MTATDTQPVQRPQSMQFGHCAQVGQSTHSGSDALDGIDLGSSGPMLWKALGAAGLIAGVYRGGQPAHGVDARALGRLLAAADERASLGATLATSVPIATCLPLLSAGQRPARDLLDAALRGDAVIALAATDEAAGCDLADLRTEASIGDDEVVLTGRKRWITNATQCDAALVLARHRAGRHFTNFTWVLVPATAPGVHVEAADTDLFDGSGTGHFHLDGVRVPRDNIVGGVGRGLSGFAAHIAVERLAGALWGVALCRRVLADTRRRLRARGYGEGTLWHLEAVRQRFAAALIRARELQALADELGEAVALRHDTAAAAMLKASAAATVEYVLDVCAHLQGAEGFRRAGVQHLRAQAALFGIGGGTTEVVLSLVADAADTLLDRMTP